MTLRRRFLLAAAASLAPRLSAAQHYQADFPPEEFRARGTKVFDSIGNEAVAAVQGAPLTNGFQLPRQSNTFYYLSGIETPGAYLLLDGRSRRALVYLPPRNERLERAEGKVLSAEDAERVKALTGADDVLSTAALTERWPIGDGNAKAVYAESAPAEGYAQSRGELKAADATIAADYWDGRLPRESRFAELLRTRQPRVALKDLTPILDEMRAVKSSTPTARSPRPAPTTSATCTITATRRC